VVTTKGAKKKEKLEDRKVSKKRGTFLFQKPLYRKKRDGGEVGKRLEGEETGGFSTSRRKLVLTGLSQ